MKRYRVLFAFIVILSLFQYAYCATCDLQSATLCINGDDNTSVWVNGNFLGGFNYVGWDSTSNPECVSVPISYLNSTGNNVIALAVTDTAGGQVWGSYALDVTCVGGMHSYITSNDGGIKLSATNVWNTPPGNDGSGNAWYTTNFNDTAWTDAVAVTATTWSKPLYSPKDGKMVAPYSYDSYGSSGANQWDPSGMKMLYMRKTFTLNPVTPPPSPTITINKSASQVSQLTGAITFTITICNTGGGYTTQPVLISDRWDSGTGCNWSYGGPWYQSDLNLGILSQAGNTLTVYFPLGMEANTCKTFVYELNPCWFSTGTSGPAWCSSSTNYSTVTWTSGSASDSVDFAIFCPSSTNTPTRTQTINPSPTFTMTITPSATSTYSRTASPSPSASPSYTPTFTHTLTGTLTQTATYTASASATFTPTRTASATPTYTPTMTATLSSSATMTATPTYSATITRSATPVATFTFTATPSITITTMDTATVTRTNTMTFTVSPTGTSTMTMTATPTFSITSTITVTTMDTATVTNTITATFTFTATFTLTFSNTVTGTPSSTPTCTDTIPNPPTKTASPTYTMTYTPTATGTDTFTRTNTPTDTETQTMLPTGTATFTLTHTLTMTNSQTLTQTATYSATNTSTFSSTVTRTSTLTPTVTCTQTPLGATTLLDIGITNRGDNPGPGAVITYRIKITNNDTTPAYSLRVWDTLPAELDYVQTQSTGSAAVSEKYIVWDMPEGFVLNPGEYMTIVFTAKISSIEEGSLVIDTASVDYNDDSYTGSTRHPALTSSQSFYPEGQVIVFPNPFDSTTAVNGTMKFLNLVPGALIQIYSLSGESVFSVDIGNNVKYFWNISNRFGKKVSPGVYYWAIKNPVNGRTDTGKIFLVK